MTEEQIEAITSDIIKDYIYNKASYDDDASSEELSRYNPVTEPIEFLKKEIEKAIQEAFKAGKESMVWNEEDDLRCCNDEQGSYGK